MAYFGFNRSSTFGRCNDWSCHGHGFENLVLNAARNAQWRNDDPGETRPYKTRPVVIVDVLADGSVAALMCTTKGAGRAGFVEIPTGGWDSNQQRSWLNTRSGRCVQPHQLNNRLGVLPQDWQSWFDQVAGQATYAEPN